jgi:hypothetical protein
MNEGNSDKIDGLIETLKFTPELGPPSLMVFLALVGIVVCLIYVGHLVRSFWARQNELVPIPVALIMAFVMFVVYFVLATMLYERTPVDSRTNLLLWSVLALAAPAIYYGRIIVDAFATRVIDQVSPFSMRIEEPSEFAEARKLALRRDVDGAVKRYRAYLENTDAALFEAARLLKSEDRYAEAAALFQEISERFYGKKLIWAEAAFHLAKVKEANLHQAGEAMALLRDILDRTPDSRFGQLAETELTRMEALYSVEPTNPQAYSEPEGVRDPFYRKPETQSATGEDNGQRRGGADDLPVPPMDPFFSATMQRAAADSEADVDDESSDRTSNVEAKPSDTEG